jgi:hypothetical protein
MVVYRSFLHHKLDELVVLRTHVLVWSSLEGSQKRTVNTPVSVLVGFANHLVNLVVGQLLADGSHDMAKLGGGNEAVVVTVEDLERLADLFFGIGVLHLARHHSEEFCVKKSGYGSSCFLLMMMF